MSLTNVSYHQVINEFSLELVDAFDTLVSVYGDTYSPRNRELSFMFDEWCEKVEAGLSSSESFSDLDED